LPAVSSRPLGLNDTTFQPRASTMSRVAPTEFANGHLLRGEAHDPRARLLGGVAGHAGMFSTAADLSRICRMLLNGGTLDGQRILEAPTVRAMLELAPDGRGTRTLRWDGASSYSRPFAPFFPEGSVGHTGFTGTAVWIDPPTKSYLIILSHRVQPHSGGGAEDRPVPRSLSG